MDDTQIKYSAMGLLKVPATRLEEKIFLYNTEMFTILIYFLQFKSAQTVVSWRLHMCVNGCPVYYCANIFLPLDKSHIFCK